MVSLSHSAPSSMSSVAWFFIFTAVATAPRLALSRQVSSLSGAVLRKHHRLGGLKTEIYSLIVPVVRSMT